MKPHRDARGVTLIELVLAITISAIVVSMVFFTYISIFKGYKSHTVQSQHVMELVVTRKKLDKLFSEVGAVETVEPSRIVYVPSSQASGTSTIAWTSRKLLRGSEESGIALKDMAFRHQTLEGASSGVLLWEGHTSAGLWVGGGCVVKVIGAAVGQ